MAYTFIHLLPLQGAMLNSFCVHRKNAKTTDLLRTSVEIPKPFERLDSSFLSRRKKI